MTRDGTPQQIHIHVDMDSGNIIMAEMYPYTKLWLANAIQGVFGNGNALIRALEANGWCECPDMRNTFSNDDESIVLEYWLEQN